MSKYFSDKELRCSCCKKNRCTDYFLEKLESLRIEFGRPMTVNCAYRCEVKNKLVGGALNSYHLAGQAVDIHIPDSQYRAELVKVALMLGWSVGVYETFVHLDLRGLQTMFYGNY